jgi:hypothetical protein
MMDDILISRGWAFASVEWYWLQKNYTNKGYEL